MAGDSRSAATANEPRAASARVTAADLIVTLVDGRTVSVPLAWFPSLHGATPAQRTNLRLIGRGYGIHWPDLDEDLSIKGLLQPALGEAARRPRTRQRR
jgi:Protein of unknown function (DUF2442)